MENTLRFAPNFSRIVRMVTLALLVLGLAVCSQAQTFTSRYSFCSNTTNCSSRSGPTAPMVQGTDGNLYCETEFGGGNSSCGSIGCGIIFKMTPQGELTPLYTFCSSSSCTDGSGPSGGLVLVTDGNFYGATSGGGVHNFGTVFRITPAGKLTTLHSFDYTDGWEAQARGLIQAAKGNFYTYIEATVPAGATTGKVSVVTPSGTLNSNPQFVVTE